MLGRADDESHINTKLEGMPSQNTRISEQVNSDCIWSRHEIMTFDFMISKSHQFIFVPNCT